MDDIIEFVIELLGELLETALGSIKNPRIRKWALTVFYSVFWLGITGFCSYFAFDLAKKNNMTGTIVVGLIAGICFFVLGFFIIRGHRRNWKKHYA
jgi:hypothetical protein